MFKAVLFDLDGTLLPYDFEKFLPPYLASLGQFYRSATGMEDPLKPMMLGVMLMMANDGTHTNADVFWTSLSSHLKRERHEVERIYADFIANDCPRLVEGIVADPTAQAVVAACKGAGRRLVLATNPLFPRSFIDERLRWAGIAPTSFELLTCADRMHFCKPRPEYYREVAEILGVDPSDCLMVGNEVAMDLEPAAAVGMKTCLVENKYAVHGDAFKPDYTLPLARIPALVAT